MCPGGCSEHKGFGDLPEMGFLDFGVPNVDVRVSGSVPGSGSGSAFDFFNFYDFENSVADFFGISRMNEPFYQTPAHLSRWEIIKRDVSTFWMKYIHGHFSVGGGGGPVGAGASGASVVSALLHHQAGKGSVQQALPNSDMPLLPVILIGGLALILVTKKKK